MPDSGIDIPQEVVAALSVMEQIAKNTKDFVVIDMNQRKVKGKQLIFDITVGTQQEAGKAEEAYEGKDLGSVDCVFQSVKDMLVKDYKDDGCFVQFYLNYLLEGNREQNKLMFLTWCPDSTNIKKKMTMSSTSQNLIKKAPKGAIGHTVNDIQDLNYKDFCTVASAGKCK
ncbi:uncharacterized protein [Clytia hemisphaerica]|uniref:uncharacterized protein n=1 Tax=Clytia hemisphaerica TaxID=252671 RepID=UPI0034D77B3F